MTISLPLFRQWQQAGKSPPCLTRRLLLDKPRQSSKNTSGERRSMSTSARSKLLSKDRNTRQKPSKPSRRDSCESEWSPRSTKNDARRIPGAPVSAPVHQPLTCSYFSRCFAFHVFYTFFIHFLLGAFEFIQFFVQFHFPYFQRIFHHFEFFFKNTVFTPFFWAVALYSFTLIVFFISDPFRLFSMRMLMFDVKIKSQNWLIQVYIFSHKIDSNGILGPKIY